MVTVANPIYDIVFKYLMEDERIARTIHRIGDAEMEHIVHRLLMAATDADVRQDMNVEDEYFSIIEQRDTEIMMKDRQLKAKDSQLKAKDALIRSSIQMLAKGGFSAEKIAENLTLDLETVNRFLKD